MTNINKLNLSFGMTKEAIARWRTLKNLKLLYDKFVPKKEINELYKNKNIVTRGQALEVVGNRLRPGYYSGYNLPGIEKQIQKSQLPTLSYDLRKEAPKELFRGFRNKNVFRENGFVHATPHMGVASQYSPMMGLESEVFMRYKPLLGQKYGPDYHIETGLQGLPWNKIKPELRASRQFTYETPVTKNNTFLGYGINQGNNSYTAIPDTPVWRNIFSGKHGIAQPIDKLKDVNSSGILDKQHINIPLRDAVAKDLNYMQV